MAKRKVPSQAASGRETFNDNLVGNQITDGSSQLTATNFSIDKSIPERDTKKFKSVPFSEFLTLDDLNEETKGPKTQTKKSTERSNKVTFKDSKQDGAKSLYGSLRERLLVSVQRIIKKFPAGFYIDNDTPGGSTAYTADNISYNKRTNITTFSFEGAKIFNPLEVVFTKPKSNTQPITENEFKNFFSNFSKYTLDLNGKTYDILSYTNNTSSFTVEVKGKPFNTTTYSDNLLIRPINSIVEEFFNGLDDLEAVLINRETKPKYTASFRVPQDSLDGTKTELTTIKVKWPIFKDGWNIKITGLEYSNYITKLKEVGEEIDNYKSNLIVRFLTTASLNEFDTEDQRMSSVFQLYGTSFDKIKTFIDNVAYMRNVSYDGIKNIPDLLLKNLSNTLGLDSVNLFDEKSFEDTLYSRVESQYDGVGIGMNMVEAETEFYRRLVINLVHIYKSKGTKKALEFFLRFIGAPEPLIKIEEHVYRYDSVKKLDENIDSDIYDLIQGEKTFNVAEFVTTGFSYTNTSTTGSTIYADSEYPIVLTGVTKYGDVKPIVSETNDVFFQKGAGWYDITLEHRSSLEIDLENSDFTVNPKIIKTKNKDFTYGEDYFDLYRQFYGLDYGYELHNTIDNDKTELLGDIDSQTLNRKNIQIYLSSAQALEYDIYRQSRKLLVEFGTNTLPPQTGVTFAEFLDHVLNEQIRNSHTVRYQKSYIQLEDIYKGYLEQVPNPFSNPTVSEFINRMSPYWVQVIEQFIPATTLWTGGNIIENHKLGRSKFDYIKPCVPNEFTQKVFPEFETAIEEDLETLILGDKDVFRGLTIVSGVTYTLFIELEGEVYQGNDIITLSGTTISPIPQNPTHAGLFEPFEITSQCTSINDVEFNGVRFNKDLHLPLLCDFKCYLEPQREILDLLWTNELQDIIDNQINKKYYKRTLYNGPDFCSVVMDFTELGGSTDTVSQNTLSNISNHAGWYEYQLSGNTTIGESFNTELTSNGETYTYEIAPIITYEIFTDVDGVRKIRVTPIHYDVQLYTYNPNAKDQYEPVDLECIDPKTFDFYWASEYLTGSTECDPQVSVTGNNAMYIHPEDSDNCTLSSDIYLEVSGITFGNEDTVDDGNACTDCPPYNTDWPVNIFLNCVGGYNESITGYTVEYLGPCVMGVDFNENGSSESVSNGINSCMFVIRDVKETDVFDVIITDAANCDQKIRIEGLQQKLEWDPTGKSHYFNYSIESFLPNDTLTPIKSLSGITYCDNYLGYTLHPKVQYRPTFDYGLRQSTKVLKILNGIVIDHTNNWRDIDSYIESGDIVKINIEDVVIGDYILSAGYKDCPYSSQDFFNAPIEGFGFSMTYRTLLVENKDCLGSIKVNKINERFSVLPNSKLRVMTRDTGKFTFTEKYPEELTVKFKDEIDPCCSHEVNYHENGDYLINEFGFPIEITSVDLDYCDRDLYYHLNVSIVPSTELDCDLGGEIKQQLSPDDYQNCDRIIVFNGDSDDCILLEHIEQKFETLDLKTQQYFQDEIDCLEIPPIEDLERPIYDIDCNDVNAFKLENYFSGEIVYAEYDPNYSIGEYHDFKYNDSYVTWEMIDYIDAVNMANLAPLYGKSITGYIYN